MKLRKYEGPKETEALHVNIGRLSAKVWDAHKRAAELGGTADPGVQAMPIVKSKNTTVGKYKARPAGVTFDTDIVNKLVGTPTPTYKSEKNMSFEHLPEMLNQSLRQKMLQSNTPDAFEKMTAQNLQSGAFKDAFDRINLHHERANEVYGDGSNPMKPFVVADSSGVFPSPGATPKLKTTMPNADQPTGKAKTPAELEAIRAEQAGIEKKLGIGSKKVLPFGQESEEQIKKRLGM
jgi:hypothetical protein